MGSVPQNRPATALLAKGSTGNPRTKAAAESAVRPAKEARRKSARQANRSPPRGSASPEIHTPKQRQRTFCFVESPENAPVIAADSALRSRSGAARPAEELRRGRTCRASRSLSCGSVSPGSRALGAGGTRAAGVDNSTLRRIVGGTSEQRVQRFEAGQARFVQRKSLAGEERAEPAGACPAAAFRREAARWADDSTFRRIVGGTSEQRIQRFEAGQARFVQRKGFAGEECAEPAGACPAAAFRREATRWALGRPALRERRFYAP